MRISDCSSDVCSSDLISSIDEVSSWAAEATVCTFSAVDSAAAFTCWVPPAESLAFFDSSAEAMDTLRTSSASTSTAEATERSNSLAKSSRRSEEHTSELQSLMRISYAVFCLTKKTKTTQ